MAILIFPVAKETVIFCNSVMIVAQTRQTVTMDLNTSRIKVVFIYQCMLLFTLKAVSLCLGITNRDRVGNVESDFKILLNFV